MKSDFSYIIILCPASNTKRNIKCAIFFLDIYGEKNVVFRWCTVPIILFLRILLTNYTSSTEIARKKIDFWFLSRSPRPSSGWYIMLAMSLKIKGSDPNNIKNSNFNSYHV